MSQSNHVAFLDCEFTSLEDPHLLSLSIVVDEHDFFYGEFGEHAVWSKANHFVVNNVQVQMGRTPRVFSRTQDLGDALCAWLEKHPGSMDICYDYHADMDLLEQLLRASNHWNTYKACLIPTHVGYLIGSNTTVVQETFAIIKKSLGIEQHHALADAFALRSLYNSTHGIMDNDEKTNTF